jgi:hypothetical protein
MSGEFHLSVLPRVLLPLERHSITSSLVHEQARDEGDAREHSQEGHTWAVQYHQRTAAPNLTAERSQERYTVTPHMHDETESK